MGWRGWTHLAGLEMIPHLPAGRYLFLATWSPVLLFMGPWILSGRKNKTWSSLLILSHVHLPRHRVQSKAGYFTNWAPPWGLAGPQLYICFSVLHTLVFFPMELGAVPIYDQWAWLSPWMSQPLEGFISFIPHMLPQFFSESHTFCCCYCVMFSFVL